MKLLVLLALLGAASAQYTLYTGVSPYLGHHNAGYNPITYAARPLTYNAQPLTYNAQPLTYNAQPYYYAGLPYSIKPVEGHAEEKKPVVEARTKRSAEQDQDAEDATLYTTYATHPMTYTAGWPYAHTRYSVPTMHNIAHTYNTLPYTHSGVHTYMHGYSPIMHSLKKRDVTAKDQDAEDATLYTTLAAHPMTYTAGWPYNMRTYNMRTFNMPRMINTPANTVPITYNTHPYSFSSFVY